MQCDTITDAQAGARTGLWRTKSPRRVIKEGEQPFPLSFIFPSGRQLLSHIMHCAGLSRFNRTAFPEWSSHCVVSAIARYSTPVPFNEVLKYGIKADAVLIYEQWGWPIPASAMKQLKELAGDKLFILDMVDSAHFQPEGKSDTEGCKSFFRFTSLSKLLGLPGGGVGITGGRYIPFSPQPESEHLLAALEEQSMIDAHPYSHVNNILKEDVAAVSQNLRTWLKENDLWGCIEDERNARHQNLKAVLDTQLSDSWPAWMKKAVNEGAGPGIAPLFRHFSDETLKKMKEKLLNDAMIETEIYHFNWTGNPLEPSYEKCLAFPVHGMVEDIKNILRCVEG